MTVVKSLRLINCFYGLVFPARQTYNIVIFYIMKIDQMSISNMPTYFGTRNETFVVTQDKMEVLVNIGANLNITTY